MSKTVTVNLKIDDYANRVLGVVKEKYGLKDKGEALNRLAVDFGDEFVDRQVKDEVVKQSIITCEEHIKKYGFRKMTSKELEKLFTGD